MKAVRLTFVGSGDAFGSGGRLQTSLHLEADGAAEHGSVLIDCGTSSLIGMQRAGVDPSGVGAVLVTHLHGDHFGGLPFLVLHGQFGRRTRPLLIAGPPGVRERVETAMEVLFPGSSRVTRRFAVEFVELAERAPTTTGPAVVTAFEVDHASGAPPYALRVEYGGKTIVYSGDTEWTDALVDATRGADLFVCEAYLFDRQVKYHLDYRTLERHRDRLDCPRIVLTHMSEDMLRHVGEVPFECAEDGLVVTV